MNSENDLYRVLAGIEKVITNDILAMEIRKTLHHLGEITGEIPSRMCDTFCIGK